jgi:hypothetical protein
MPMVGPGLARRPHCWQNLKGGLPNVRWHTVNQPTRKWVRKIDSESITPSTIVSQHEAVGGGRLEVAALPVTVADPQAEQLEV